jgi:hypothetical protein
MRYGLKHGCDSITYHGFPHSGISGLTPVSGFPELIAAYYALRRLRAPRHPPYALPRLTIILPAQMLYSSTVIKEHWVYLKNGACANFLAHAFLDLSTRQFSAYGLVHLGETVARVPRGLSAEPAYQSVL